jgi:hypothetical protein
LDGRLIFDATSAKGRKTRQSKPPQNLYEDLKRIAGPRYVFEAFSDELRAFHRARGRHDHAASVRDYAPHRLVSWLEDEVEKFRITHPDVKKFKLHNFRGTSMSKAKAAGVSYDEAAVAYGCHPETMRKHYIDLDEIRISDSVFDRIGGEKRGESRKLELTVFLKSLLSMGISAVLASRPRILKILRGGTSVWVRFPPPVSRRRTTGSVRTRQNKGFGALGS